MFDRRELKRLTLYTGSNGRKGCTCKCIGCSQEKYGSSTPFYQATEEQVKELLTLLPNIKDCIILGNPDPSVDPDFCNWIARYMVSKGIRVRLSSSGVNALEVAKKLFQDVDTNFVDYMSYSVDSINTKTLKRLKGRDISLELINEAIEYCKSIGVTCKIQPTLWNINKNDYEELVEYYLERGVNWFSFHVGSKESFMKDDIELEHILPEEWIYIRNRLEKMAIKHNFSLHMPYIFLNDEEYRKYQKENGNKCDLRALRNTQVWIEKNGFRTTHCPLLREKRVFDYELETMDMKKIDFQNNSKGYCPVAGDCFGGNVSTKSVNNDGNEFVVDGETYHTICRWENYSYKRPIEY